MKFLRVFPPVSDTRRDGSAFSSSPSPPFFPAITTTYLLSSSFPRPLMIRRTDASSPALLRRQPGLLLPPFPFFSLSRHFKRSGTEKMPPFFSFSSPYGGRSAIFFSLGSDEGVRFLSLSHSLVPWDRTRPTVFPSPSLAFYLAIEETFLTGYTYALLSPPPLLRSARWADSPFFPSFPPCWEGLEEISSLCPTGRYASFPPLLNRRRSLLFFGRSGKEGPLSRILR